MRSASFSASFVCVRDARLRPESKKSKKRAHGILEELLT